MPERPPWHTSTPCVSRWASVAAVVTAAGVGIRAPLTTSSAKNPRRRERNRHHDDPRCVSGGCKNPGRSNMVIKRHFWPGHGESRRVRHASWMPIAISTPNAHALVRCYCQTGAYSTQEQACQRHVTVAQVDRRANHGDLAAIKAEPELRPTRTPPRGNRPRKDYWASPRALEARGHPRPAVDSKSCVPSRIYSSSEERAIT